jgi:hypothetical protein
MSVTSLYIQRLHSGVLVGATAKYIAVGAGEVGEALGLPNWDGAE